MLTWMAPLAAQLPKLSIFSLVDILVTAFLIYQFLTILKGRRAANVLVGLGVLVGMYVVAFAANLDWKPTNELRARGSLQHSVRAPNFGELFDGGGGFPSFFDPCSVNSVGRTTGADAAKLGALCTATGVANPSFVATPGGQAETNTTGNVNLKPESSNSVTLGLVWAPRADSLFGGFRATADYYRIKVKDAIASPDVNEFIADCYNYNGRNPS